MQELFAHGGDFRTCTPHSLASSRTRIRTGIALMALLVGLAGFPGCSQLPFSLPQERLSSGFEMKGRVAIRYADESASANVHWRHTIDMDDLLITNPLEIGRAHV